MPGARARQAPRGQRASLAEGDGARYSARMSARMLAFGGLVIAGAALALVVALRRGDVPPRAGAAAESATARGPAKAASANPGAAPSASPRAQPPRLPAGKPEALGTTGVGDAPLWTTYDEEERDPRWATGQEQAIRDRLRPLLAQAEGVQVPAVECREEHCRLIVTGSDQRAFQSFVESLQDERGFYGDAVLLALDGYGETDDERTGQARYQVRVHLRYAR